eukprot:3359031-Prymnesium_polylepis.1
MGLRSIKYPLARAHTRTYLTDTPVRSRRRRLSLCGACHRTCKLTAATISFTGRSERSVAPPPSECNATVQHY